MAKLTGYNISDMEECIDLLTNHVHTVKLGGEIFETSYIIGSPPFKSHSLCSPAKVKKVTPQKSASKTRRAKEILQSRKVTSHSPVRKTPEQKSIIKSRTETLMKHKSKVKRSESNRNIEITNGSLSTRLLRNLEEKRFEIPGTVTNKLAPVMAKPNQRKLFYLKPPKAFKKKSVFESNIGHYQSHITFDSHKKE